MYAGVQGRSKRPETVPASRGISKRARVGGVISLCTGGLELADNFAGARIDKGKRSGHPAKILDSAFDLFWPTDRRRKETAERLAWAWPAC